MSTRALVESFEHWSAEADALVLITVVATEGSTYSKTGRQILMQPDGRHAGLVSGGCLEGDLVDHARQVCNTGEPKRVTYDMRDDADDLWGIGLGCNGMMQLFLQRISRADDWQPFKTIAQAYADKNAHTLSLITQSDLSDVPAGTCIVDAPADHFPAADIDVLNWQARPWPRLLILGAAPDALPVARFARQLGWIVTVADHRPHYFETSDFGMADQAIVVDPTRLTDALNPDDYSAIVVMSHHLETDRKYLQHLADSQCAYIGVLGPAARKQKLLDQLENDRARLSDRLHGPVGIEIGSDTPETIALALIAEIQAVLAQHENNQLKGNI